MDEQAFAEQIFIVDDDADIHDSLKLLLESAGFTSRAFASARDFLADPMPKAGCLVADIRMPDMSGLELQEEIARMNASLPVIIITGHADVPLAVKAMKAGAIDFIEKPFDDRQMIASIHRALEVAKRHRSRSAESKAASKLLETLTQRERSVLAMLVRGKSNKVAAYELGISPRTVEIHRAHIMDKLHAASLSELVRIALAAENGVLPDCR